MKQDGSKLKEENRLMLEEFRIFLPVNSRGLTRIRKQKSVMTPPPPSPTHSLNRFGKWAIFATLARSKKKVEGPFPRKTKHGWAWLSIWLGTQVSTHYTEPIVFIAAAPNPHAKCGFTRLSVCVIGLTKEMAGTSPSPSPPSLYPPSLPTSSKERHQALFKKKNYALKRSLVK
jgi:hypothetical protein